MCVGEQYGHAVGITYNVKRISLAVRVFRTIFTHKNVAFLKYVSSKALTGASGITFSIVSMRYEQMHFPEAHQEVSGNLEISRFQKGTRHEAHGEQ